MSVCAFVNVCPVFNITTRIERIAGLTGIEFGMSTCRIGDDFYMIESLNCCIFKNLYLYPFLFGIITGIQRMACQLG